MNFAIYIGVFAIGALFAGVMSALIFNSKETTPDEPSIFAANKLQRQDIHVAISMDRYDEEPEETIRRVKKEFAKEIIRLIDNQIEVTPDYKTRHFVFSVVIWTKEAADENQDQETN